MYLNKENVSPTTGPISHIMVASIYNRYSTEYRALNNYHSWCYQSNYKLLDSVLGYRNSDPEHITAILGQTVHFNCHANFPNDEVVPYVVQWEKRGSDTPIFIWWVLSSQFWVVQSDLLGWHHYSRVRSQARLPGLTGQRAELLIITVTSSSALQVRQLPHTLLQRLPGPEDQPLQDRQGGARQQEGAGSSQPQPDQHPGAGQGLVQLQGGPPQQAAGERERCKSVWISDNNVL